MKFEESEKVIEEEVQKQSDLAREFADSIKRLVDSESGVALAKLIKGLHTAFKERAYTCEKDEIDTWRGAAQAMNQLRAALAEQVDYSQYMSEADEEDEDEVGFNVIPGGSGV